MAGPQCSVLRLNLRRCQCVTVSKRPGPAPRGGLPASKTPSSGAVASGSSGFPLGPPGTPSRSGGGPAGSTRLGGKSVRIPVRVNCEKPQRAAGPLGRQLQPASQATSAGLANVARTLCGQLLNNFIEEAAGQCPATPAPAGRTPVRIRRIVGRRSVCSGMLSQKSRRFGDAQAEVDAALRLWNPSDIRRYVLHESVLRPLAVEQQE